MPGTDAAATSSGRATYVETRIGAIEARAAPDGSRVASAFTPRRGKQ